MQMDASLDAVTFKPLGARTNMTWNHAFDANYTDGVIDNSHATLQFLSDGKVAGSTGCNRLMGSYEINGKQLTIQPGGTTMMACPPALMNQERKLLDLLPTIRQFRVDATGALILQTDMGSTVLARRSEKVR